MVTLSVTRSRIAGVLRDTAALLQADGWDPLRTTVMDAIDRAAGYVPGKGSTDAERTALDAYEALATHLNAGSVSLWERETGRTQLQVLHALRTAATEVMAS